MKYKIILFFLFILTIFIMVNCDNKNNTNEETVYNTTTSDGSLNENTTRNAEYTSANDTTTDPLIIDDTFNNEWGELNP